MNQRSRINAENSLADSKLVAEYADELSQLREACAQHVATLPPCLQRVGESFLQRCASRWQSMEWVLPLALGRDWFVPQDHGHSIAAANALTAMHVHIQRQAVESHARHNGDLLPLGSLLYTRALCQYKQLFPPISDFWLLLEGYHLEWSEAVLWERQRQWGSVKRYSREDILRLAGSRALLKLGCVAVALLAGKRRALMPLGSILDHLHIAVQLMNDVLNWREDLHARRATFFLTEIALALDAQEMATLGRLKLVDFLATGSLPDQVIKQVQKHLSTAKKVADHLDIPSLATYLDDLEAMCEMVPHQLERDLTSAFSSAQPTPASASL